MDKEQFASLIRSLQQWWDKREARRPSSDRANTRRLLRASGTLHDASDHNWLNRGQPFTPNGVPRVNRDLLKKEQIEVKQEGAIVVLTAGTAMMQLPYEAALQVSRGFACARRSRRPVLVTPVSTGTRSCRNTRPSSGRA